MTQSIDRLITDSQLQVDPHVRDQLIDWEARSPYAGSPEMDARIKAVAEAWGPIAVRGAQNNDEPARLRRIQDQIGDPRILEATYNTQSLPRY